MAGELNINWDIGFPMGSTKFLRYRTVTLTSASVIVHTTGVTTGAAGVRAFGVAQDQPRSFPSTQGKIVQPVRFGGITKVQASTRGIKVGQYLTMTSGAVASTSFLGGCVKATTSNAQGVWVVGVALTSMAAGASPGYIMMAIAPIGRG